MIVTLVSETGMIDKVHQYERNLDLTLRTHEMGLVFEKEHSLKMPSIRQVNVDT